MGDEGIPASLTGAMGDPARGRAIVANRQVGLCLLCHTGPFPEERFQGNLAPDLAGRGPPQRGPVRLRMVDPARVNPKTIMPAYYRTEGLDARRARLSRQDRPQREQIEDVVAYLADDLNELTHASPIPRPRRRGAAAGAVLRRTLAEHPALRAAALEDAIRKVVGAAPVRPGKVKLDVPPLVENGNAVPLSVAVDSPMTERRSREGHPRVHREEPAAQRRQLLTSGRAPAARSVATRIAPRRYRQTVIAIAQLSDGIFWSDSASTSSSRSPPAWRTG